MSKEYIFYTFVLGGANFVEMGGVGVAPASCPRFTWFIKGTSVTNGYLLSSTKVPASQKSIYLVRQRYKRQNRVFNWFIKGTSVTNGYLLSSTKVPASQKSIYLVRQRYKRQNRVFN